MDLHLRLTEHGELADQVYQQIKALIRGETLRPNDRLPSTRELAVRASVSRSTVAAAYERLALDGLIASRVGAGTFVVAVPPVRGRSGPGEVASLRAQELWDDVYLPEADDLGNDLDYNFALGLPSVEYFPFPRWRALLNDTFRKSAAGHDRYPAPAGDDALREAISKHVTVSRSVTADPDRIVITSGTQQAVDVAARVLLAPDDAVAVEDPGYGPVRTALAAQRLRVCAVPVDDEGLVVELLPDDARLVYVTPAHQFPLGVTMSQRRRMELLAWAEQHGAAIVEDDYDSEFRYLGRALDPLHTLDTTGRVIYVGSFAKTLLPSLRIGFLLVPASLAAATRRAKFVADFGSPTYVQRALAAFLDEGGFSKYIRRMRRIYERRHHLIRSVLLDDFADVLEPVDSMAGLHLAARLTVDVPDIEIRRAAQAASIAIRGLSEWSVRDPAPQGLVFGYGGIDAERIPAGLARLREIMPAGRPA